MTHNGSKWIFRMTNGENKEVRESQGQLFSFETTPSNKLNENAYKGHISHTKENSGSSDLYVRKRTEK